ncbi:MAG: hypothetical protein ABI609_13535 [Acidobacteriota bacterium]
MHGSHSTTTRSAPCGLDDSLVNAVRLARQVDADRIAVCSQDGRQLGVVTLSQIWAAVALRELPLGELRVREIVSFSEAQGLRRPAKARQA